MCELLSELARGSLAQRDSLETRLPFSLSCSKARTHPQPRIFCGRSFVVRFTFERLETSGALSIIEEIPDFPLCHLEGRNGVGKTLAVHLLELASGTQPYASTPSAWQSLRRSLGRTRITISGLSDQDVIVDLTPSEWPDTPIPPSEWLGEVRGDEDTRSVADLAASLHVFRIAGDETFEETIRAQIESHSALVQRLRVSLESRVTPIRDAIAMLETALLHVDPFEDRQRTATSGLLAPRAGRCRTGTCPRNDRFDEALALALGARRLLEAPGR